MLRYVGLILSFFFLSISSEVHLILIPSYCSVLTYLQISCEDITLSCLLTFFFNKLTQFYVAPLPELKKLKLWKTFWLLSQYPCRYKIHYHHHHRAPFKRWFLNEVLEKAMASIAPLLGSLASSSLNDNGCNWSFPLLLHFLLFDLPQPTEVSAIGWLTALQCHVDARWSIWVSSAKGSYDWFS